MEPYVYILASAPRGTLYVGVTSDLVRRVWEHREALAPGFTRRYGIKRLVYYEAHGTITAAIQREKTLKHWLRSWKIALIEANNPHWDDLWPVIAQGQTPCANGSSGQARGPISPSPPDAN